MNPIILSIIFVRIREISAEDNPVSEVYETKNGPVFGAKIKNVRVFRSIPYAENPPNRWKEASAPKDWNTPLDTRAMAPKCIQATGLSIVGSEACLYLYLYTPAPPNDNGNRSVLVFIHGGGLQSGDGYNNGFYEASILAQEYNLIVVSIQYRLGAYGFLSIPFSEKNRYGNFGFLDQRLALEWVQANIQYFGGSAQKVTLAGESAGAISVCSHLATSSKKLFSKVIMESGSCEMQIQSLELGILFARSFAHFRIPGCGWVKETTPVGRIFLMKKPKKIFFFYSAQYLSFFSLPLFQKTYTKCKHVYFKIFFDFFSPSKMVKLFGELR